MREGCEEGGVVGYKGRGVREGEGVRKMAGMRGSRVMCWRESGM